MKPQLLLAHRDFPSLQERAASSDREGMRSFNRRRLGRVLCGGAIATSASSASIRSWVSRFFSRPDPKVVHETYQARPDFSIGGQRLAVFVFDSFQRVEPRPADLGRFVALDLMLDLDADQVVYHRELPWSSWPQHRTSALTDSRRLELLSQSSEADLGVYGRLFWGVQSPGRGPQIEAALWVFQLRTARILWYGFKRIEWRRRVRMYDAMAHAASLFVLEWPLERSEAQVRLPAREEGKLGHAGIATPLLSR